MKDILNLPTDFFSTPIGSMMRGYFDQMMGGNAPQQGSFENLSLQNVKKESFEKSQELYDDSNKTTFTFKAAQVGQIIKYLVFILNFKENLKH
jgi:hypothetical protein